MAGHSYPIIRGQAGDLKIPDKTEIYISSNPPSYKLNDVARIWVNKNDPGNILVDSFTGRYLVITIHISRGLIFGLIGSLLFFISGRFEG